MNHSMLRKSASMAWLRFQRFLLLVIPHAGRGLVVNQGVVSDTKGLVDFSMDEMARKGFRSFFKEVQEKNPFPLVDMDPSYVGFLFTKAYQLTLKKGGQPPQDYLRSKSKIEGIQKEYGRPLIYSYLERDEMVEDDRRTLRLREDPRDPSPLCGRQADRRRRGWDVRQNIDQYAMNAEYVRRYGSNTGAS
jgi:hypothetical protein